MPTLSALRIFAVADSNVACASSDAFRIATKVSGLLGDRALTAVSSFFSDVCTVSSASVIGRALLATSVTPTGVALAPPRRSRITTTTTSGKGRIFRFKDKKAWLVSEISASSDRASFGESEQGKMYPSSAYNQKLSLKPGGAVCRICPANRPKVNSAHNHALVSTIEPPAS